MSHSFFPEFRSASLALALFTLTAAGNLASQTVLTVAGESVSAEDFAHIFKKNNRDSVVTPESLDEYMELFIDFKLKVKAAEDLGMDTATSFVNELAGYRKQLARPYLVDNELLDALVEQAYDRTLEEVRASHLLVQLDKDPTPADTTSAWGKAMALKERIMSGEDFASIAQSRGGSDDPSVKDNGGDLGWFSAFMMVYPFEDACFKAEIGDVVGPVRTRFGYHIIKVTGKRSARGELRCAHIMIRPSTDKGGPEEAKSRIDALAEEVAAGADFAELARQYSDDQSSRTKGGELPWFGTGRMVESFEEAAFALASDGAVSAPVQTQYGWHLIQRLEYKAPPTFEASRRDLEKRLQRDSRSEQVRKSFIEKRKAEYGFALDAKRFAQVAEATVVDSTVNPITVKKGVAKKPLLTIGSDKVTVSAFVDFVNENRDRIDVANRTANEILDEAMAAFADEQVIAYEDARLEQKHDDFRLLMEEYHDGILLFELTDRKVWSRAVKDSAGLQAYWAENEQDYRWKTRLTTRIYRCADAQAVEQIMAVAAAGGDVETTRREMISESPLSITVEESRTEVGLNPVVDAAYAKLGGTGITDPETIDGQLQFVEIITVTPPEQKTLEEARGKVIADFQDFLERTWIEELRASYPFEINRAALHAIR